MPIVDANIILRYLLDDHPEMSEMAKELILSGAHTTAEILAEVVYVLKGVYHVDRHDIAATLEAFLQEISIDHKAAVIYAFRLYGKSSLDFMDCLLAGYHHTEGKTVATFDKNLLRALETDLLSKE